MFKKSIFVVLLSITALLTGCASVPMASIELDTQAKTFATKADKANIYVYRNESIGAAVKMDIAMDGKTIGQTAAKTYIALQVPRETILCFRRQKTISCWNYRRIREKIILSGKR